VKKIVLVTGIRPNLVKAFPVYRALLKKKFKPILIHTNQHSDKEMFELLWKQFNLPEPILLKYTAKNPADRLGKMIIKLSKKIEKINPDLIIVFGDGDSTLAGSLVASKLRIPLAHVEAGLRSFDRNMPEEHNRTIVDHLSDMLFITEPSAAKNLINENISKDKTFFVGNTMIDTLILLKDKIKNDTYDKKSYILLTLHRPSNVDNKKQLKKIISFLKTIKDYPILFPIHPRTEKMLHKFNLFSKLPKNIELLPPLSYLKCLSLERDAFVILTDSGGIQEESTFLNVPCLTIRDGTERPVTLTEGSNSLVLSSELGIYSKVLFNKRIKKTSSIPKLWDGDAGERIAEIILQKKFQL